jgi:hypothetical protein
MKTWKVTLELSVSDIWIQDGFDLEEQEWKDNIAQYFESMIPYAFENEIIVKNLKINETNK